MRRRIWFSIIGVIAVAAIVIGINMFADARLANQQRRPDAEPHLHAVARHAADPVGPEGARDAAAVLLPRLGSTVPAYGTYADHVREMLGEYAAVSDGKMQAGILRSRAVQRHRGPCDGLRAARRAARSGRRRRSISAWPAAIWKTTNAPSPFFQPERERFLEYDLTKLVYELSNPKRPVVGVMSSLPLDGDPRAMMMAMRGQPAAAGSRMHRRCCCGRPIR